jgi:hypothetical protein
MPEGMIILAKFPVPQQAGHVTIKKNFKTNT